MSTEVTNGQTTLDYSAIAKTFENIEATRETLRKQRDAIMARIAADKAEVEKIDHTLQQIGHGRTKRPDADEMSRRITVATKALTNALKKSKGVSVKGSALITEATALGLDRVAASGALRKLIEDGKVTAEGEGRSKTYNLPKN